MTISKLDDLAAKHHLWDFDVGIGFRRPSEGIVLKRKIGDVITLLVKVDEETETITSRGIYVHTNPQGEADWYELTEEQFDKLALAIY